jgi:hypothetical protein
VPTGHGEGEGYVVIWWIVGLVVVIAALGFVLQRRGSSSGSGPDGMRDAGATQAPEAFRNRPEGTGGMGGSGS